MMNPSLAGRSARREVRSFGATLRRMTDCYFVTTSSVTVNDRDVFREFPLASIALPKIFRLVTPVGVAVVIVAP